MRLPVASVCTLAVATLASNCTDDPAAPDATNLLVNGGFEVGSDGTPAGWVPTVHPELSGYVEFNWSEVENHTGERSASIVIHDDHPADSGPYHYNWYQAINDGFTVGETYELGVWVKTEELTQTAWITVLFVDSELQNIDAASTQFVHNLAGTRDWTFVDGSFSIPAGTAQLVVRAGISAPANAGGRAWFDDLAVTQVDGG